MLTQNERAIKQHKPLIDLEEGQMDKDYSDEIQTSLIQEAPNQILWQDNKVNCV